MVGLGGLGELLGVAEQYQSPGGAARHGERVGERVLAGLVDDQDVHLLGEVFPGPQTGGAADQPVGAGGEGGDHRGVVGGPLDAGGAAVVVFVAFLEAGPSDRFEEVADDRVGPPGRCAAATFGDRPR